MIKQRWLLIVVSAVILLITSIFYSHKIFSFHFVDEEDNFILGKYILNGDKVYGDLFSHHQPLTYILSSEVQSLGHPQSVYSLIKQHRLVVIIWSVIWSLLLIARFGARFLGFITVYELSKIYLLGNLFLSESLAVYPLIYLVALVWLNQTKVKSWESLMVGFCLSLVFWLLSPLWPLVIIFSGYYFWLIKTNHRAILLTILGMLPLTILVLLNISISNYFYQSIYLNFKYYIPIKSPEPIALTYLKAFTSPLLSLFVSGNQTTLILTKFASICLIINLGWLAKIRKFKLIILLILFLGLSNLRYIQPGTEYYEGFHLLPWFATLLVAVLISGFNRLILTLTIAGLLVISLNGAKLSLFNHNNPATDYYINYSRQITFGTAINLLKNPQDKLFIAPDEAVVYWQANINHASSELFYYAWMDQTQPLHDLAQKMFLTNPPTFVYKNAPGTDLEQYLGSYYQLKKDGQGTDLYMRLDRYNQITPEQKAKLEYLGFEFATINR